MKNLLHVLPLIPLALLTVQSVEASTPFSPIDDFATRCPAGTIRVPFEEPIYDGSGLFVIGYRTVYYCIPGNTRPAG